jgi:uncharacterized protein DUF6538
MGKHSGHGTVYCRGGRWVLMRRVPKRFEHLDQRKLVRIALRTDSEAAARAKAPAVAAGLDAYWEALEAGNSAEAAAHYKATVKLAAARGFTYRPAADLLAGDLGELVARVQAAIQATGDRPRARPDADALLGLVPAPRPRWSEVLADFLELTRDRLKGKSPD